MQPEVIILIEVDNLTKKYGQHIAVDNISFVVNDGEVVGFLGPNGAGKTTTMNMMTGFISSTEGTVKINGYDILENPVEAKKHLGYMPDVPPLYGDMIVNEYLNFVCDLKSIPKNKRKPMLDEIRQTVKIDDVQNRLIKNLSKGYRQRVGLAQALIGFPDVLILDEPTVGLDPTQILEMRDLIKSLGKKHTIILSSHILSEVSAVCNRVMVINKGRLVDIADEDIVSQEGGSHRQLLLVKGDAAAAVDALRRNSAIESVSVNNTDEKEGTAELLAVGKAGSDIRREIFLTMVESGIELLMLKPAQRTLEDIFMQVINGEYENADAVKQNNDYINMTMVSATDTGDKEAED